MARVLVFVESWKRLRGCRHPFRGVRAICGGQGGVGPARLSDESHDGGLVIELRAADEDAARGRCHRAHEAPSLERAGQRLLLNFMETAVRVAYVTTAFSATTSPLCQKIIDQLLAGLTVSQPRWYVGQAQAGRLRRDHLAPCSKSELAERCALCVCVCWHTCAFRWRCAKKSKRVVS